MDPVRLHALAAALTRGLDSSPPAIIHDEIACLGVSGPSGEVLIGWRDEVLIAWDGRLDNADVIDAAVRQPSGGGSLDRLARAYSRWGTKLCEHLVGDFALVVWDSRRHRLLLARDPMGVRPLFYCQVDSGSRVVWASSLRAVRAGGDVGADLDDYWIAGYLAHTTDPHRTPYRDVRAVGAGEVVIVEDGTVRTARYWTADARPTVELPDDASYEERFAELFVEAVRCRLSGAQPVLAELSGGLDSSSIVCVADYLIRQRQVDVPELLTVSSVYDHSPTSDERRHIRQVEERIGRAGLHVTEEFGAAFEGLDAPSYEYPTVSDCMRARLRPGLDLMAARGMHVLLSGFGGDNVVHGEFEPSLPVADRLHSGGVLEFLRAVRFWGGAGRAPYPALAAESAALAIAPFWYGRRRVQRLRPNFFACLDEDLVRRTGLVDQMSQMSTAGTGSPSRRRQVAAIQLAINTVSWMYDPGPWAYRTAYPFLHRPLVDFCLGVPSEQFIRPGESRSLHRRALRGWLPTGIAHRSDKRGPGEAIHRDLATGWERLQPLVDQMEVVRRGYLNHAAFLTMVRQARFGRQAVETMLIMKVLALELWLRPLSG